ncbi:hypothetical protein BDL97_12G093300 [Sphagnum fallax]|nr:hypothetical protein BDL97_12G093300 [Sphagnum fallax]
MVIHNAGQVFLKTLLGFVVHCPHPNLIISNSDVKPDTNLHLHGRDEMELQCSLSHGVGSCVLQAPVKSLFWGGGFKHCMWKFLSKGENVYGKRMEHRVFDPGFDCTFSLLCQGNWKEQCITVVFFFFKLQLINGNRHWKNNLRKSNCRPGRM